MFLGSAKIQSVCGFLVGDVISPLIAYDIAEFETSPFRQIPFEILAYRNARRRMGLQTPMPAHPLLDSPFVKNLPAELPPAAFTKCFSRSLISR